ncbi:MAG: gamma-glutamylcyclotransferase family protein [Verrucomicrobiota bacterium]
MSENALFVYGSLLSMEVLEMVIGRVAESQAAELKGYACYYVEGATFPAIVTERGAKTPGKILNDLTAAEIATLDRYEDTFYQRTLVEVQSGGESILVMAYVVPDTYRYVLSAKSWTWEDFEQYHLADYIARMRGV